MTNQKGAELRAVVAFLLGEAPLEGRWFGEQYDGVQPYWWRRNLRIAWSARTGEKA